MLVRAIALAAIFISVGTVLPSQAAEPSGEAVAVIQATAVEDATGNRPLQTKGPVFMGDLIRTDQAGQAQLRFKDNTKLVIGPNSELTIDSFVLANQATAQEFTINAIRGAFRFISGSSQKQAYTIKTPNATIGVRGTKFDLTFSDNATNLALYEGGVQLCDTTGPQLRCTELSGRCRVIVLGSDADFRWVNNVYERTDLMDAVFPYAFRQTGLQADFRVESHGCEIRNPREIDHDSGSDRPRRRREGRSSTQSDSGQ